MSYEMQFTFVQTNSLQVLVIFKFVSSILFHWKCSLIPKTTNETWSISVHLLLQHLHQIDLYWQIGNEVASSQNFYWSKELMILKGYLIIIYLVPQLVHFKWSRFSFFPLYVWRGDKISDMGKPTVSYDTIDYLKDVF